MPGFEKHCASYVSLVRATCVVGCCGSGKAAAYDVSGFHIHVIVCCRRPWSGPVPFVASLGSLLTAIASASAFITAKLEAGGAELSSPRTSSVAVHRLHSACTAYIV